MANKKTAKKKRLQEQKKLRVVFIDQDTKSKDIDKVFENVLKSNK